MKSTLVLRRGLILSALMGALVSPVVAEPIRIGIANFGEHPQLNQAVDGFKKALTGAGFVEGKDVTYSVSHTNFDVSLVPQMLSKLKAEKPKLILAITTPVAQNAKKALSGSGIPVVFTAVTDPVGAKLMSSWTTGEAEITGSSDLQDVDTVVSLAKRLVPSIKALGLPYNPGEANDVSLMNMLKAAAEKQGIQLVGVGVDNVNDIQQRVASFKGRADVIYTPTSNLLMPAISAVASSARQIGIPMISASDDSVKQGLAVATVAVGYEQVGRNAGNLAAKILKGADPKTLAPIKPAIADHVTLISRKAAAGYKLELPKEVNDCRCFAD